MKTLSFGKDMAQAILADKKYLTTRKLTTRLKVGDKVQAMTPSRFGKVFAHLLIVKATTTKPAFDALWSHSGEGFETPEAYLEKLKTLHDKIDLESDMTMLTFNVIKKFPEAVTP